MKNFLLFVIIFFLLNHLNAQQPIDLTLKKPVFIPQPKGTVYIPPSPAPNECCAFYFSESPVSVKEFQAFIADLRARGKFEEAITAEKSMVINSESEKVLLLNSPRIINLFCRWESEKLTDKIAFTQARLGTQSEILRAFESDPKQKKKNKFGKYGVVLPKEGSRVWTLVDGKPTLVEYPGNTMVTDQSQAGELRFAISHIPK